MNSFDLRKLSTPLLFVLLVELFIGGGGRLITWGPVSMRMVLFAGALILTGVHFLKGDRLPKKYWQLLIGWGIVLLIGLWVGIANGSVRTLWWEDIKPLLFFFILPFFHFAIGQKKIVEKVGTLLSFSGVWLAASFVVLLILIHTDTVPFLSFYSSVIHSEEFFFRGELTFFYKGFLYLSIGFIFIYFTGKSRWLLVFIAVALVLTVTRGFWLALVLTFAVYFVQLPRTGTRMALIGLSLFLALTILVKRQELIAYASKSIDRIQRVQKKETASDTSLVDLNPRLLGDRAHSDDVRLRQIKQVLRELNLGSVFFGHGFGQGTALRPVHMEIAYLEIFHKQGLLGLAFWGYLFFLIYRKFSEIKEHDLGKAFYYSTLFVFIQSSTNQYVNNPIGLGMVLLALVCIDRIGTWGNVN